MRAQGLLTEPVGAGPADHVCWIYEDQAAFASVAATFLAGGLARGERLLLVGEEEGIEHLRRSPGPLGRLAELEARGVLTVLMLTEAYDADGRFVPEQQYAFYDDETRRAVAEGYTGLRTVADVTRLAADPRGHGDLARWEHMADRLVASGSGFSPLCGYRVGSLREEVLADVASVHPMVRVPHVDLAESLVPFRVFFEDGRVAVAGCVDAFGADRLRAVLGNSPQAPGDAVLDLSRLGFVDGAGCRVIAGWAEEVRRGGHAVRITGAPRVFVRAWHLLGYAEATRVPVEGGRS